MHSANSYGSYGGYGGYSAAYNAPLSTANISYETNSKDPILLRARVFVGNLNPKVGRDEIIKLFCSYGTLLGVTVFKGYAFVQFSHGSEADIAVNSAHGYNWNGNVLDVKLAVTGQGQTSKPGAHLATPPFAIAAPPRAMGKRNQQQFVQPAAPAPNKVLKRMKVDESGAAGPGAAVAHHNQSQEKSNKAYAAHVDHADIINIQQNDIYDTLICGGCRFITSDLAEFVAHRKEPCKPFKQEGEPDALQCNNCNKEFPTSWALLSHLSTVHNTSLFKEVYHPPPIKSGENGANSIENNSTSEERAIQQLDGSNASSSTLTTPNKADDVSMAEQK